MYNRDKKRNTVNDVIFDKLELRYNTAHVITNYKMYFKTDSNDEIIFYYLGTIFYNNVEMRTFDLSIPGPDKYMIKAHTFIEDAKQEIRKGLNEYIKSCKNTESSCNTLKNKIHEETDKVKDIMYEIRFIDTFAFMATSIESLSNNLRSSSNDINELRKIFKNTSDEFKDDEQFKLMIKKGVYPYDYIDNFNRLNMRYLPNIKAFHSKLYKTECDIDDYKHAQNVFNKFGCKSLLDYHNIYLKSDVLLLSDIWDNFRHVCHFNYGLDTSYYYTAPGLSWDAMLKITKILLELLTDVNMFKMWESGTRGGISQISHRHAVANNKYMSNYDDKKDDSYIVYLDANNLYGHAMSQYLPTGDFKWNEEKWNTDRILKLKDDSDIGYLFDVDVSYPEELHDYLNQYSPLPENMIIKKNYLNDWQQKDYNESKINKLCCSLASKKNYVVNYRYLKLALSLGVKLDNVNRVLQFKQSDFLKQYIMLNTGLRTKAKNDFEKDFYKLINNAVFGKTMENIRNRIILD